jgi:nicotinate-nucleotide adenylyltransferase
VSSPQFGVFGGSFDPPHVAHTLLVAYALSAYPLERVLIVPTFAHAFGKQLTDYEHRLHMCELAFGDLRRAELCDVERELPQPNLMLNTLHALQRRFPDVHLRLLVGADIMPETSGWYDFAAVERLAPPIVIERQGATPHAADQPALPAVSSTEVRRRLHAGDATHGWLAPAVADYIHARNLYRG